VTMMMMFHLVVVYSRSRHCATPRIDSSGKERAIPRTNESLFTLFRLIDSILRFSVQKNEEFGGISMRSRDESRHKETREREVIRHTNNVLNSLFDR
jgi:hypothetical protein